MKPAFTNARHAVLLTIILFIIQTSVSVGQTCNNWLNNPAVNAYVNVGDLDIPGNTVTVEALINRTQSYLPGGGNGTEGDVVSKHNTFTDINYLLRPNHAYITTTNGFFGTPDVCDIELNKTYHVALVYDGSTLKFYRDGLLMSQVNATGDLVQNNWKTRIGWYEPQGFTTQFIGYTNEVKIWNVARTQAQIKANMTTPLTNPASQPGLLAYYTFDNLLNKQGNTAFNGTLGGSATINQTNPNCTLFVDSCAVVPVSCNNKFLTVPSALSGVTVGDLDIPGNAVTIEALCDATGDITRALVSKHANPSDVNYFLCPDLAQITTTNGFFSIFSACPYVNNKTYHVALVYDGSTLKLYRNGYLMTQTPATGNLIQNDWPTTIGEQAYAMYFGRSDITNVFKGVINEVRIWNVARTQAQLQTYMDVPLPSPTTIPGLLAYYSFDDLNNKQGNSAWNGTLKGSASINGSNPYCNFIIDSCNTVTPVTITSFSTKEVNNKRIVASWHTDEEYDIVQYIVQRSTSADGGFVSIGAVNANSNSRKNNYSFQDNTARPNTTYFYRLKIMEKNGSVKYSEIRKESLSTQSLAISVYPNPSTNNPSLSIRNYSGKASLAVFNNLGQVIFSRKVVVSNATDIEVKLNNQPKGTYWLQLSTDNQTTTKKLIRL